ncbi:glycosyltransferase family 9 protein [candidate division KSB1 bacterium]|nr:glycosyltransferase family 9 protein [candidate division KSB1 bacterium]
MFKETHRIKIAKWIDEYAGRWLIRLVCWLQPAQPQQHEPAIIDRILFVKFWGIGSIILAEPTLRYLRKKHPQARLDFLTLAHNQELFALIPQVNCVHCLDFRHLWRFVLSAISLILQLRRQRYDLIIDAEFFANFSALVSRLAYPRCLVGFSRPGASKSRLLDIIVPFLDEQHAADNFLRLVMKNRTADISGWAQPQIATPKSTFGEKDSALRPFVVMNVNASPLALERRWPQERFVQLAQWLLQTYEVDLALIGSPVEREYTDVVAAAIGNPYAVRNLAGTLTLIELAALIENAALFISNDSGPLHLAAALQKPVAGFFGPETPERFGPRCDDRLILYLDLPCSPCMSVDNAKTVNCTNHLRCMGDLKVALVIPSLQRFIEQRELLPKRVAKHFLIGA